MTSRYDWYSKLEAQADAGDTAAKEKSQRHIQSVSEGRRQRRAKLKAAAKGSM